MNETLIVLDYACINTQNKYNNVNQTLEALSCFVEKGTTDYFTNDGQAREYIDQINFQEAEKELMKNIVKLRATKNVKGIRQILGTNKTLNSEDLTQEEAELIIFERLKNYSVETVASPFLEERGSIIKYLASSYISSRCFINNNFTTADLEKDYNTDLECNRIINKIDQYYNNQVEQIDNFTR